jgi:hypothetical protein
MEVGKADALMGNASSQNNVISFVGIIVGHCLLQAN